jgi:hypothetical protein
LSSPGWARRSTGGSVACTHEMRVRFPPGPPERLSSNGSGCRALDPAIRVRFPSASPYSSCGGKGRRPWGSHTPRNAGSIPASATNSRFVQWKDGGLTSRSRGFDSLTGYHFDGGRRQTVRRGSVKPVLAGSTPVAHPNSVRSGRRVIGSPPASGAGAWRFESSRPDHCQIV